MSTTPSNEKIDKTVPFTTSEDAAKANGNLNTGSVKGNGSTAVGSSTSGADLVNRVAQTAHATIDRLANQATPAVQHLQKSLENTNDMLHQRADQARDMGSEWCESLRGSVRQHPLAAVGTALAVGLLIARLTR